jgi:hypothetical protein
MFRIRSFPHIWIRLSGKNKLGVVRNRMSYINENNILLYYYDIDVSKKHFTY